MIDQTIQTNLEAQLTQAQAKVEQLSKENHDLRNELTKLTLANSELTHTVSELILKADVAHDQNIRLNQLVRHLRRGRYSLTEVAQKLDEIVQLWRERQ